MVPAIQDEEKIMRLFYQEDETNTQIIVGTVSISRQTVARRLSQLIAECKNARVAKRLAARYKKL